jgi:hypothetical protein
MRCAFCGGKHYWRLLEYHRPVVKHKPRSARGIRAHPGMVLDKSPR